MPRIPDIGNLSSDQTKELALNCLSMLSLSDRINVVKEAFSGEEWELDELLAQLQPPEGE